MFGELEECEAKKMFGDEKGDDYDSVDENSNLGLSVNGEINVSTKLKSSKQQQITAKKKNKYEKKKPAAKEISLKKASPNKKSTREKKNFQNCEELENVASNKNIIHSSATPKKNSSENGKKSVIAPKQISSKKVKIPQIWSEEDDNIAITSMVKLLKTKKL